MSCTSPLFAVNLGTKINDLGKKVADVKLLGLHPEDNLASLRFRYGDSLMTLPCGRCLSCRTERAKQWSIRCYLESLSYDKSSFLTLTYSDENTDGFLHKQDVQKFIKSLRNDGIKVRYFACGEYGSRTKRPHYHLLLFGYWPSDARSISFDNSLFTSKYLESKWNKGLISLGFVEGGSIAYTSRYCMKKITDHYTGYDNHKEFILMSKRPGLGRDYIDKNLEKLLKDEKLYCGIFGVKSFTRYIKNILNDYDPFRYSFLVDKNKEVANQILDARLLKYKNEEAILKHDNNMLIAVEKSKKRSL